MKKQAFVDVCERNGWTVRCDEKTYEISQFSPAGEDFGFSVRAGQAVSDTVDYCKSFDVDEHVEMWVDAKHSGVGGIPSIRMLLDDAEEIQKMLDKLASDLMHEAWE